MQAVFVCVGKNNTADRGILQLLISERLRNSIFSVAKCQRSLAGDRPRGMPSRGENFHNSDCSWLNAGNRVGAIRSCRGLRLSSIQYTVGVKVYKHFPTTQTRLDDRSIIEDAVTVQIIPHDASDGAW